MKAISLDAKFAPSYASMGLLRIRQNKNEEALKFLTEAVQGPSASYLAHYYFAYMLQQGGRDPAADADDARFRTMRAHLKKAIELASDYPESYDLLGYVSLNLGDEGPETEALLKNIFNMLPGRRDLRLRLGELMIMNKELAAARFILAPLQNGSTDDFIRQQAETLLANIQAREQNAAAMREYEERQRANVRQPSVTLADSVREERPLERPPKLSRPQPPAENGSVIGTARPNTVRVAGPRVEGILRAVDCSGGITLHLTVENKSVDLHSDDPSQIEFVSYTTGVSDSIVCGPMKPALPVVVVYRVVGQPQFLGEPIRVEFVEKK
jgi:Tfp pilus assembly protein PilF